MPPTAEETAIMAKLEGLLALVYGPVPRPPSVGPPTPASILQAVLDKVLKQTGQELVRNAIIILNTPEISKFVPPEMQKLLNDRLVGVIYQTMPHPPQNLAGFDFRSTTGADNLGKAGMPYARTVLTGPRTGVPPDAQKVFDTLMKREIKDATTDEEKFVANKDGLSSLTFAYGTLVIHSVFHTALGGDGTINDTSSYFDLSPLYGDDDEECNKVRCKTGRGLLYPDCFLDDRMLFLPPAAAVLLVLFNRNHNNIAKALLKENERGKWTDPPLYEDPVLRDRQDEEIFQTARLINCAQFVNIVITDYVGGLMGGTKRGGGWPLNADPFGPINFTDINVGRGEGNLVSIEFNTLYRWHATLSEADVEWAKSIFGATMNRKEEDLDKLKPKDYNKAAQAIMPLAAPKDRVFAGLTRGVGGKFADQDLANILYKATEQPAGEFRARGSPGVMSFIDVRGILWARSLGMCTFNEFRDALGLPKYKSFTEWNADEGIAAAASELYNGNIDDLELYPGLHAEGHAGDGLGKEYDRLRVDTMRNGLLFDAVALIRGDRFLTHPFPEKNLTKWGYKQVQRDPKNKAFGGHIHKLLFDTLGTKYFPENSVYSWFPMTLPQTMRTSFANDLVATKDWTFDRPSAAK